MLAIWKRSYQMNPRHKKIKVNREEVMKIESKIKIGQLVRITSGTAINRNDIYLVVNKIGLFFLKKLLIRNIE